MTLLKKIGQIALQFGKSLVGAQLGATHPDAPYHDQQELFAQLLLQVVQSEIVGARLLLSGTQKREMAAAIIEQLILRSPYFAKRKLADPMKFRLDVERLTGSIADILNDFEDSVQTTDHA